VFEADYVPRTVTGLEQNAAISLTWKTHEHFSLLGILSDPVVAALPQPVNAGSEARFLLLEAASALPRMILDVRCERQILANDEADKQVKAICKEKHE
jgi:hypothetical protein